MVIQVKGSTFQTRQPPPFLEANGTLTTAGRELTGFIEAQFKGADLDNDIDALNRLSGPFKQYYVNVYKTKAMTPEVWVVDQPNSARNAWRIMEVIREELAEQDAARTKTKEVVDGLAQLKEELMAKVGVLEADLAALRAENEALRNPGKSRKSTDTSIGTEKKSEGE